MKRKMHSKVDSMSGVVAEITARLGELVEAARAEGRAEALAEVAGLVSGGRGSAAAAAPAKRGPGRPKGSRNKPKAGRPAAKPAKAKKPRKSGWAGLTPEARLARINAIRVGRGLPPKDAL
jgi:hypothetical protein